MTPDLEILHEMIKIESTEKLQIGDGKPSVKLTEPPPGDYSVTIFGLPEDAIVIKVDDFPAPKSIFANTMGECKRADYVIVANHGKKKSIVYIELKRHDFVAEGVTKQLMGAKCFMTYCQGVGQSFWEKKDFLKAYQQRFVVIHRVNINKQGTRLGRKSGVHDEPGKALRIGNSRSINFNQLMGKSSDHNFYNE